MPASWDIRTEPLARTIHTYLPPVSGSTASLETSPLTPSGVHVMPSSSERYSRPLAPAGSLSPIAFATPVIRYRCVGGVGGRDDLAHAGHR